MNLSEDQLEAIAKRLYPYLRGYAGSDEELATLARKLWPHLEAQFNQNIGASVVGEALALFRRALWVLGGGLLAWFALKTK